MKRHLYILISLFLLSSCLKEEDWKLEYNGYTPVSRADGWEVSTPEAESIDAGLLEKAYRLLYSDEDFLMANSLIVVRNGKIVAEAYCRDLSDIDRLENIQSCTKSFTALLTGCALKQGLIESISDPVYQYIPEYFDDNPDKRKITIRNCLTMMAGLDFDNSENTEELLMVEGSSLEYILSLDMIEDTGLVFRYNDGLPHLVGGIIAKQSGMILAEFADENLFGPLGISNYKWETTQDGLNIGSAALRLIPRDLAKTGQLCLQEGRWGDRQLFDPSWLQQATAIQAGTEEGYGYYFWIYPALEGYAMLGHGGQYCFVCPSKNLVMTYTAFPYTNEIFFDEATRLFELIIKGCY
jgi:CubicO group peptidase (beta-lactamase class C family)